MLIRKNIP